MPDPVQWFDITPPVPELTITPYQETFDDYRIKYEHCYGVLNDKLILLLEFFREEDEEGDYTDVVLAHYRIFDSVGSYSNSTSEAHQLITDIDWTLPRLGAINFKDTVIFLSRRHKQSSPSRYRRGFRADIVHAFEPTRREYAHLDRDPLVNYNNYVDNSSIAKVFFKKYYSPAEALEKVLTLERMGAAFSPNYYYTLSLATNSFFLWRGDIIVGTYSKSNKKFKRTTGMFDEELSHFDIPLMEAA